MRGVANAGRHGGLLSMAAGAFEGLSAYKFPNLLKSTWQIMNSLVPFVLIWLLMFWSLSWSYGLTLLLSIPAAGFLVRIFIIQHDCGHHSFFRSRELNDFVGTLCGVLTLTPYYLWRRSHSRHHASSGNLHHRGHGDVWVLTVREYLQRSGFGRFQYRVYRHPMLLFVIGPFLQFAIRQRFTYGVPVAWRRERRSVHVTNLGIALMIGIGWWAIGLGAFTMIHLPIVAIAASVGSWLFFVQHQYEQAYWQPNAQWDSTRAAMDGSSYYRLPRILQWFTGNIGFHHIHHLESRIPNYNLPICYEQVPALQDAVTLGVWDSVKCARFKLWDEQLERMVTFGEAHAQASTS